MGCCMIWWAGTTTIDGSGDVRARVGAADDPITLGGAQARGKTIVADLPEEGVGAGMPGGMGGMDMGM